MSDAWQRKRRHANQRDDIERLTVIYKSVSLSSFDWLCPPYEGYFDLTKYLQEHDIQGLIDLCEAHCEAKLKPGGAAALMALGDDGRYYFL